MARRTEGLHSESQNYLEMCPGIYSRLQVYEVPPLIDQFPSGQGTAVSILHFINLGYAIIPLSEIPATDSCFNMNGYPVKEAITWLVSFSNSFCTASLNSFMPSNLNHFKSSLIYPHSFSIKFTSRLYAGWNSKITFSGIFRFNELWNPPLSSLILCKSSGEAAANSSKNFSKHTVSGWVV